MTAIRSKPSGYGVKDKFTYVEAEIIDSQLPYLIDSRGGTYVLSANLSIGGAQTMTLSPDFLVLNGGTITVDGPVMSFDNNQLLLNASSDLHVSSTSTFEGDMAITGSADLLIDCSTMIIDGPVVTLQHNQLLLTATSDLLVQSTATFDGAVTVSGTSDWAFAGTIYFTQAPSFNAGATMAGALSLSSAGHINERYFAMTNANATKGVEDCDVVYMGPGIMSASRSLVLSDTGAVAGSRMRVYVNDNAYRVTVYQNDTVSAIKQVSYISGDNYFCDFMHNGSSNGWFVIGAALVP